MLHRFLLTQRLDKDIILIKDRELVHQLRNVLKYKKGDRVIFFNQHHEEKGIDAIAELKSIEHGSAVFLVREKQENPREPSKKLTLYQSLIKKERFEWVLQKGTEVGVIEFVPFVSTHAQKKSIQKQRCESIIREAAEQSGRAIVPIISHVLTFEETVLRARASSHKTYFVSEHEHHAMIRGAGERSLNVFIGPEGGWGEKEIFMAQKANFEQVSLGRLVLRSETAALTACFTLLWG